MQSPDVQVGGRFVEDVAGGDEAGQSPLLARSPMLERPLVILVDAQLEGEEVAGIDEDLPHEGHGLTVEVAVVVHRSVRRPARIIHGILPQREDRIPLPRLRRPPLATGNYQ